MRRDDAIWMELHEKFPEHRKIVDDLEFMAKYKFDYYEGYRTGDRFANNLLKWLAQMDKEDRVTALRIADKILFIAEKEMHELAIRMYYNIRNVILEQILVDDSGQFSNWDYRLAFDKSFSDYWAKSLFISMSDSSKIDYFRRHANIDNESIINYYKVNVEKLFLDKKNKDVLERKEFAFLMDDLSATGTTFLNQITRLQEHWSEHIKFKRIYYCPYIITHDARTRITEEVDRRQKAKELESFQFRILFSIMIPTDHMMTKQDCKLFDESTRADVKALCDKYYDPQIEDEHTSKGGGIKYGFGNCGLLFVKYDNCPNDSIYPLWYKETSTKQTKLKNWNPLFLRIARHKEKELGKNG
jgi:hypothetical protein